MGFVSGACCYAPNALVSAKNDFTVSPPTTNPQGKAASPTTSRMALRTRFSMPKNMRAARIRIWRRRSRTAARRGRTPRPRVSLAAAAHDFRRAKHFNRGLRSPPWSPAAPRMPLVPGRSFRSSLSVSGQLRSDAGLDGPPRRNGGWHGRWQRPHLAAGNERRRLVGRRDARRRRSAEFGLVKKAAKFRAGSLGQSARGPNSAQCSCQQRTMRYSSHLSPTPRTSHFVT